CSARWRRTPLPAISRPDWPDWLRRQASWYTEARYSSHKRGRDMVHVERRQGETEEQLLKRFRKKVAKSRILTDARRKRWYLSPSEQRRIEKNKAIRRARRRQSRNPSSASPSHTPGRFTFADGVLIRRQRG